MYYFKCHYDHTNTMHPTTIFEIGRLCLRQSIVRMMNKMQINRKIDFNCHNDHSNNSYKAFKYNEEIRHFIHNQPILTNTLGESSIILIAYIYMYVYT